MLWQHRNLFASKLIYASMYLYSSKIKLAMLMIMRKAVLRPVTCNTSGPVFSVSEKKLSVKYLSDLGLQAGEPGMSLLYTQVDNNWISSLHSCFVTVFIMLVRITPVNLSMHKPDLPVCNSKLCILCICAALSLPCALKWMYTFQGEVVMATEP